MYEKANPLTKKIIFSAGVTLAKNGATIPPLNQAAAIVLKNSDKAFRWPVDSFLIRENLTKPDGGVNRKMCSQAPFLSF